MHFIDATLIKYEILALKDPKKLISKLLPKKTGLNFVEGYSGKGMLGRVSDLAFSVPERLSEKEKKLLDKKLGEYLHTDHLGLGFIYYT